jgi:hypothetical protein
MIYTAEKALKDNSTIPEDIKTGVTEKVEALKKEKDSGTLESIKSATEALSTEMQKIGEHLSKQAPQGEAPKEPENPDIKDAEVKEDKKDEGTPNA